MALTFVSVKFRKGEALSSTKLREAREKIPGLTQAEIAKQAGITTRAYQIYESGERIPRADVAVKIARTVKSTVEKLFG